jgi:hypothetical protein
MENPKLKPLYFRLVQEQGELHAGNVLGGFALLFLAMAILFALALFAAVLVKAAAPGYAAFLERTLIPLLPQDPDMAGRVAMAPGCALVLAAWAALDALRRGRKS